MSPVLQVHFYRELDVIYCPIYIN